MRSWTTETTLAPLVLNFDDIDANMLPQVGGKAANLGEMTRAGLSVPPGFCVTTEAYTRATSGAELEAVLDQLAATRAGDIEQLEACAAAARSKLSGISIPTEIIEAVTRAYASFMPGAPIPVAVRSSATAEDLPFASFAGQQDTYLNIVGIEAILDAIRRCWASLWTDRAVSYRESLAIDHRNVRLAVVVQRMVEAQVAGVLFTANPLTGRRRQAVIDANPGLGEAVVSGAVNPDHFVVNAVSGEIIERHLGDKRVVIRSTPGGGTQRVETTGQQDTFCLTDAQVKDLARLGTRVEAHYGAPQDVEWALDGNGHLWLTQARPITTLYPLPAGAPSTDEDLRVYFSANVAQGIYRPFTPMGVAAFRLAASSFATFLKLPPRDVLAGPTIAHEAASRIFFDITPALRSTIGRQLGLGVVGIMEARARPILQLLASDPRLSLIYPSRWPFIRKMITTLVPAGVPYRLLQALLYPAAARRRMWRQKDLLEAKSRMPANANSSERLSAIERLFLENIGPSMLGNLPAIMGGGLGLHAYAGKLLGKWATRDELQTVLRGLPYNVTTEMDLELWKLAQQIRADAPTTQVLLETPPDQLARGYQAGTLPATLQQGLAQFVQVYGHRAVAEIDMGLPRWSEDPTHILGVLANYLQLNNPELAPDVQFQRGAREAEAMVEELTRRARKHGGWLRAKLVHYCLSQARALGGLRELPKFYLILLMANARRILWPVGEELAQAGRLEAAEDIFFITLVEVRQALAGHDFREIVRERKASYEQEMERRHIPRILLSDGTEPEAEYLAPAGATEGALTGSPASAGVITAQARVIMDPVGARLEPGEILVAPSTDPGWTPLFLTAGGLVMEMGGSMSHGAVVAREYGIPAVVGVYGATERITTGQRITVDGSSGVIVIGQGEMES
jgi:phosphohistidine swiveling domain-containing protein